MDQGGFVGGEKSGRFWINCKGEPTRPVDRLPMRCEKREGSEGDTRTVILSYWKNGAEALEGTQLNEADPRAGGPGAHGSKAEKLECTYLFIYFLHIHVSLLFQILFPVRLLQNIEQSSLCYTAGLCWLSILECTY